MPTSNPGGESATNSKHRCPYIAGDLGGFNALRGGFNQDSLYVLNESLPIVRRANRRYLTPPINMPRHAKFLLSRKSPLPNLEGLDGSGLPIVHGSAAEEKAISFHCLMRTLPLALGSRLKEKARRREPAGLSFEVGLFAKLHSHFAEICVRLRDGFVGTLLHDCGPVIRPHGRPSSFLGHLWSPARTR